MKKALLISSLFFILFISTAVGQTFEMYVSDGGNFNNPPWQILKFDENGENGEVFTNEALGWPQDIVFLEDQGKVIVSNLNNNNITEYDVDTGVYLGVWASGINGPTRMKIGPDSLLYVLQWNGTNKVLRYNLDGTLVDEFTSTGLNSSIGIDWDSEGNLYVSSYSGGNVRMYNQDGVDQGDFISSGLSGPTNIWFDESGELLVANWNGTTVKRFDANGNFIEDFLTGLENPEGVAFFPNGNILIGDGGTSAVKLFDEAGNFIEDIVPSGTLNLLLPNAVVLRDISPVSTKEPEIIETDFVQPSIGSMFYLNAAVNLHIEKVEIYNSAGVLVEKKELNNHEIWNAGLFADGIYFIHGHLPSGEMYLQKVMVKK